MIGCRNPLVSNAACLKLPVFRILYQLMTFPSWKPPSFDGMSKLASLDYRSVILLMYAYRRLSVIPPNHSTILWCVRENSQNTQVSTTEENKKSGGFVRNCI